MWGPGLGRGMKRDAFQRTVLGQSDKLWGSGGGRRMTSRSGLGGRMRGIRGMCSVWGDGAQLQKDPGDT